MAKGVKTGGRVRGTPNKITADIRALAQNHTETAIAMLATILTTSENDSARIAAAKELLDRGYGKSTQAVEMSGKDGDPIAITKIERVIVDTPNSNPAGVRPAT
jgi:hypothetical protein